MTEESVDRLLTRLSEQQALPAKHDEKHGQHHNIAAADNEKASRQERRSSSSDLELLTPVSNSTDTDTPFEGNPNVHPSGAGKGTSGATSDVTEMMRLKKELDMAKDQIARQRQELDHLSIVRDSFEQNIRPLTDLVPKPNGSPVKANSSVRHGTISPPVAAGNTRQGAHWDTYSIISDTPSLENYDNCQHVWSSNRPYPNGNFNAGQNQQYQPGGQQYGQQNGRTWTNKGMVTNVPQIMMPQQQQILGQRAFSGPVTPVGSHDYNQFQGNVGIRRSNAQNRATSLFAQVRDHGWDTYGSGIGSLDGMTMGMNNGGSFSNLKMYSAPLPYQPRPIGTPLSPTAAEFRAGPASSNPWNSAVS